MIASDELHKLIATLSQSEKRYFKIYASRHVIRDGNYYVKLFDAIVSQKKYDEQKLKEKFRSEKFFSRFAAVKNYLYRLVLKSMRTYQTSATIDHELKEMLADIEFLYHKGLYKQCRKLYRKAEKLAIDSDKKIRLLEILEWKRMLQQARPVEDEIQHFYKDLIKDEMKILDDVALGLKIKSDVSEMFSFIRKKGFARSSKDLLVIKKVIAKYEQLNYKTLAFNDKYYINYINTIYHSSSGDHLKSCEYTLKNFDLLNSIPPKLRAEEFEKDIVTLNNLVVNYVNLQRYDQLMPHISKIRSLATHNIRENILLWVTSYKLILGVSVKLCYFDEVKRIIKEMEQGLVFYHDKIPVLDLVLLKYNMAVAYFILGDLSRSLRMLNELLNEQQLSLRDDIQSFSHILRLMIFWEKEDLDTLSYVVVSTYRFLKKRHKLYRFEIVVLEFIRHKLPSLNSKKKQLVALSELKKDFEKLFRDPLERKALEYFDFVAWIESKLLQKEMKVLLKERLHSADIER